MIPPPLEQLIASWSTHLTRGVHVLPILGPVRVPDGVDPGPVLRDLLTCPSGAFLPYDKNARWADAPWEHIERDGIELVDGGIIVPTRTASGARTIFAYCTAPSTSLISRAKELLAPTGGRIRAPRDLGSESKEGLVFLEELPRTDVAGDERGACDIVESASLTPIQRATFSALADDVSLDGFAFLWERIQAGNVPGEVLVALHEDRIIGAMGPLSVGPDPFGVPWLLPSYFGVLASARRRGAGAALWRAAMDWGSRRGATYALLQNSAGTPAAAFYERRRLVVACRMWSLELARSAKRTREQP